MMDNVPVRSRTVRSNRVWGIATELAGKIKRSFLLKFSFTGLVMTVFAGVVLTALGHQVWAGLVGMAGIVMFLWGALMWVAYLLLAKRF